MTRFKRFFKQRYFKNLFFSYSIMLCALFIIYVITFSILNNIITLERENIVLYMSANAKTKIDSTILRVEQMAMQIMAQNEVKSLMESPAKNEFTYNDYKIFQYLQSLLVLDINVENIYLYRKGTDKIISAYSVSTLDDFYSVTHKNESFTMEEWLAVLEEKQAKSLKVLPSGEGDAYITYVHSFPFTSLRDSMVQLVVLMNTSEIANMALKGKELACEQFAIANKNDEIVFSYGDLVPDETLMQYLSQNSDHVIKDKVDGRKIVVEPSKSDVVSWKYITVVSNDIYNKEFANIGLVLFLCALIYSSIGIGFIYFFSKRNYEPLERLIENFEKFELNSGDKILNGEFDAITEKINKIYNDNKELQKLNEKNVDKLQSYYFKNILDNVISRENFLRNASPENYGIEFSVNIFSVILIKIENLSELQEESSVGLAPDLVRYSIANVVTELIGIQKCKGYCLALSNDMMVAVVNFSEKAENSKVKDILYQIMIDLKSFFFEHYSAVLSLSSTEKAVPLENLNLCYREASQAMDYRFIRGKNKIIFYNEIADKDSNYSYRTDTEEQLIRNLKTGNYEQVKAIIDRLFCENVYSEKITVDAMRSFVFDLARTLIKNVPQGDAISLEKIMSDTARENHEKFLASAKIHCEKVCENFEKPLSLKVEQYIEKNYANPDLCVNSLGEYFNFSPSYLSKRFKEETNKNLLVYIHQVRIAKVKELLLSDMTLEEIARKVGYQSSDILSRNFKKYEGVTPGQYRRNDFKDF